MRCTNQMNKHKHCIYKYSRNASSRSFSMNTIKPAENATKWVLECQIKTVNVKHHWHHIDIGIPKSLNLLSNKGKVRFTLSNYHKSLIFNLQLRNRITEAIQLLKPDKFGPLGGFEGSFSFCEN